MLLSLQPDVPSAVQLFYAGAGALIAARHWEYLKALLGGAPRSSALPKRSKRGARRR